MPPPVTLTGTITCVVHGSVKFGAALTNGGSSPATVTVKAKLRSCTGAGVSQQGLTVKGGTLLGTSTGTFPSSCSVLTTGSVLPSISGDIKWSTSGGKAVPSTVTITSETAYYDPNENPPGGTFVVSLPTSITGGSFSGQSVAFGGLTSSGSAYTALSKCSAKGVGSLKVGKQAGTVTISGGEL
ncbi:MAG: hypothetical protein ACLQPH_05775 [Acidimicrobiales bacterium]